MDLFVEARTSFRLRFKNRDMFVIILKRKIKSDDFYTISAGKFNSIQEVQFGRRVMDILWGVY